MCRTEREPLKIISSLHTDSKVCWILLFDFSNNLICVSVKLCINKLIFTLQVTNLGKACFNIILIKPL